MEKTKTSINFTFHVNPLEKLQNLLFPIKFFASYFYDAKSFKNVCSVQKIFHFI